MKGSTRLALMVAIAGGLLSFAIFTPRLMTHDHQHVRVDVNHDLHEFSFEVHEGHRSRVEKRKHRRRRAVEVRHRRDEARLHEELERAREQMERARSEVERLRESSEGARIRISGPQIDFPSDEGPLVYVDGVRIDGGRAALKNISPETIDRVEVLKGDAAGELYGEEASSGVVQIFLKPNS